MINSAKSGRQPHSKINRCPNLQNREAAAVRNPGYDSFQGMTLRSISWNNTAVTSPNMPITTMPTNI